MTIFSESWFIQDDGEDARDSMMFAGSSDPSEGTAILDTMDAFSKHGLNPAEAARLGKYLVELHNLNLERRLIPAPHVPENTYDPKDKRSVALKDPLDDLIEDDWG